MFRKKFIDKLRDKYQGGGYKNPLIDPYISAGVKDIKTDFGTRTGIGGRLSVPILSSGGRGLYSSLRGEMDAFVRPGGRSGIPSIESQLGPNDVNSTLPGWALSEPSVQNTSLGLRGIYNRSLGRRNNIFLKSNIGAGYGIGEKRGEYMKYDPNAFGNLALIDAQKGLNVMKPYADANISLLRRMGHKQGIPGVGGLTASYGTKNAPNPGLRLGLKGSAGPLSAGVGYDFTNKAPRFNVGLRFKEGGWKSKAASFGLKALSALPKIARFSGSKLLGLPAMLLGSTTAYAPPVIDPKTGIHRFTGKPEFPGYTPFGQTPPWETEEGYETKEENEAKLSTHIADATRVAKPITPKINQTGGMYEDPNIFQGRGARKYHEGGTAEQDHMDMMNMGTQADHFASEHGNTGGDTGSGYSYFDSSTWEGAGTGTNDPTKPPKIDYGLSWGSDEGFGPKISGKGIVDAAKWGKEKWDEASGLGKVGLGALGLAGAGAAGLSTIANWGSIKDALGWRDGGIRQQGGMYNEPKLFQGRGTRKFHEGGEFVDWDNYGPNAEANHMQEPHHAGNTGNTGGEKLQERIAKSFSGSNIPARINMQLLNKALANKYLDDRISGNKYLDDRISRGKYETIKKQTGGMALPGGQMNPIPGSDAIEFSGQTHNEGGIMMDPQTEVEDGETMDQITMAKRGGKRKDYFFSSHLKLGGRKFSDIHKDILQKGGTQEDIDWLAQMQEKKAGRNPNQIAKLGGIANYQMGGEFAGTGDVDNNNNGIPDYLETELYDDDDIIYTDVPVPSADNPYAASSPEELAEKQKKQRPYVYTTSDATRDYNAYLEEMKGVEGGDEGILTFEEWSEMKKGADPSPSEQEKEDKKGWLARLKQAAGDVPAGAYVAGAAQLLPAAHAWFSKQPDAEQVEFTPGFTSPIVAERGKASDLERVNYNQDIANIGADIRGMNRFIETSGGGPANIINKMVAFRKGQQAKSKVRAAETRANIDIANREAQMEQQMTLSNLQRSQQAAITNAQLARAEAARADQVEAINAAARQKLKEDKAAMKGKAVGAFAQGISGILGDVLSYKAAERVARTIGTEGIYERDELIQMFLKEGMSKTEAKKKAREVYNAQQELLKLKS